MPISIWNVEVLYTRVARCLLVAEMTKYNFCIPNSMCIEGKSAERAAVVQMNALSYRKDPYATRMALRVILQKRFLQVKDY